MRALTRISDLYVSKEFRLLRAELMAGRVDEYGFLRCQHCGEPITKAYECIAHHVKEVTIENLNDISITLNPDNIKLVHLRCHNIIHNRFGGRLKPYQRKVYYVWGAPCSGKSSFVKENMQAGDIVLDIDRLWSALSGQPEYIKPNSIKAVVFNARNAILDSIKTRAGEWQQAFVIEGGALVGDRMRRIETLGAESILIEATREECLQRLARDESRTAVQPQWIEYIDRWFAEYQPDNL